MLLSSIGWAAAQGASLPAIERTIVARFDVPWISTATLAQRLQSQEELVLLDVREHAEFEISTIQGARRVNPDATDLQRYIQPGRPIVVFCSVGYRSGELGRRLLDAGASRVQNLRGGIFTWANEGRPLARRDGRAWEAASQVHPYDENWGQLLRASLRSPL